MGNVPGRSTAYLRGNDLARFESYITKSDDGCWLFGDQSRGGYGLFFAKGKHRAAHRWAYEHWVGPIPGGYVIDHLCRQRSCVNPEHLEAVTPTENRRRWKTDTCRRDHSLTDPENVYVWNGVRHCRACRRGNAAKRRGYEGRKPAWDSGECQRGHDVTDPANVYTYKGERYCKPCRREASQRYEAASPQRKNRKRPNRQR